LPALLADLQHLACGRLTTVIALSAVFSIVGLDQSAAGETTCWFENGAVVIPAEVAGIAGDYVIDPSTPITLLHNTRAEQAGYGQSELIAEVRLAGRSRTAVAVRVVDLDERGYGFVTPIAGVIGADTLAGQVVWLDFSPCRLRLEAAGWGGPARPGDTVLQLTMRAGLPAVGAAASDDRRAKDGLFAIDWGSAGMVRISEARARVLPTVVGSDYARRDLAPARLRALSLADRLDEQVSAGLISGLDEAYLGTLGVDYWSRWTVRLDLAEGRLILSDPDSPPPGRP